MSEIRATTISDAAGTGPATLTGQYAAKAWVNFNGTGTVAIRESGNVSSITDNGTGNYDVNFTTSMADENFCCELTGGGDGAVVIADTYTTSSVRAFFIDYGASYRDVTIGCAMITR